VADLEALTDAQKTEIISREGLGIFGNNVTFVQEGQSRIVRDSNFVLIAGEGESFTADVSAGAKARAFVLQMKGEPGTGYARGALVAAAILLTADLQGGLPSFIQKVTGAAGNVFRYLPKLAPMEWSIWMSAIQAKTQAVGSAA